MRRLGRSDDDKGLYALTVCEMAAGEAMPEPPEPAVVQLDQPPPGVHPDSHALHQRVRARMRQLDRGDDEYVRTLDEVMREEA